MSKAIANEIFKQHGLEFVKVTTHDNRDKCFTNNSGKRVKGMFGAGIGPMTLTSIPWDRLRSKEQDVHSALAARFKQDETGSYLVEETSRSVTKLRLSTQVFPAYTRSANMDDAYRNHYIVPFFEKVKK
ncbi:MAG: hypothetical protein CMF61_03405 [Magnetococcales bacterium]|nr:hypothetical protein [Magnetococcales bacterium]